MVGIKIAGTPILVIRRLEELGEALTISPVVIYDPPRARTRRRSSLLPAVIVKPSRRLAPLVSFVYTADAVWSTVLAATEGWIGMHRFESAHCFCMWGDADAAVRALQEMFPELCQQVDVIML
ncbi:MAG: hypothetical protein Q8Q94_03055 [bacterium]|nr:hypothetical protein [bacterium]MDZ4299511.1 hypothetical protein [Candidatus Sungbacteria bacterium]